MNDTAIGKRCPANLTKMAPNSCGRFHGLCQSRYGIIHATDSLKKYPAPAFTLPCSNFPATPAIPTALEIEPAYSVEAADTRRTNQEAPVGTPLAANGRCGKNWNFFCIGQQLGTRHHHSFAQDDKKNCGIPQLHATQFSYKMSRSEFTLSIMWNSQGFPRSLSV